MNIVFLGGGRITSAMLAGLRLSTTKHRLIVHDPNSHKMRVLKKRYAAETESDLENAVHRADLLVIAVRPDSIQELLQAIGEMERPVPAVSLAAGVPLRALKKMAGAPIRWARAMPSPVCRSGGGLTAVTFSKAMPPSDRDCIQKLFSSFGRVIEIPETHFDAFTVAYSCSHGYHALDALATAAERAGLNRKTAQLAAAHALADGIVAWRLGRHSLHALLKEAATPGGIAATTATAMDRAGYRKAVQNGMAAGLERAKANAGLRFRRNR